MHGNDQAGYGSVQQPPSSASPSQSNEQEEFRDIFSELMTGTEHEMSFLVRYYADCLAAWYAPLSCDRPAS
jgi:hypothetical protein